MPVPLFRIRTLMIAVAVVAAVFGCVVVAHRKIQNTIYFIEADAARQNAAKCKDPVHKAELIELAEKYERLRRGAP